MSVVSESQAILNEIRSILILIALVRNKILGEFRIGRIPKNALVKKFSVEKLPLVSWPMSGGGLVTWRQEVDGKAIWPDVRGYIYVNANEEFWVWGICVQPKGR